MVLMLFLVVFVMPFVTVVVKNSFTFIVDPDPVTVSAPGVALYALTLAGFIVQADVATFGIMQCTADKTSVRFAPHLVGMSRGFYWRYRFTSPHY